MPALREAEATASVNTADLARRVFSPIARDYDRPARLLSLFQYRRWHRFLLSRLELPPVPPAWSGKGLRSARPDALVGRAAVTTPLRVLDMATGTGALAFDILSCTDANVTGADITRPMLRQAQTRADGRRDARLTLVECSAESPPFARESFDAVAFAYLLRYVSDVPTTLRGLARLLKPGGMIASLDFAIPRGVWYPLWRLYTDVALPSYGRLFSRHWRDVGAFLGPSIRGFYSRWPEERLLDAWRDAGFADVRSRRLSLGGAVVVWGTKAK